MGILPGLIAVLEVLRQYESENHNKYKQQKAYHNRKLVFNKF